MWGALSDERTSLSFTTVAGLRQHNHSPVRVPWDSWPYFTIQDWRLPFSSPPTTRRGMVEVFNFANTRDLHFTALTVLLITSSHGQHRKHRPSLAVSIVSCAAISMNRQYNIIPLLLLWPLPSNNHCLIVWWSLHTNWSTCHNVLQCSKHLIVHSIEW
jgi:hypothetical protein